MKKPELVFIPSPGISHLAPTIEIAKLLINRYHQLSITILNINTPESSKHTESPESSKHTESLVQPAHAISTRIRFVDIPIKEPDSGSDFIKTLVSLVQNAKPHVKEAVSELFFRDSTRIVGVVLDMFCVDMIDIGNEFEVPSYLYFTSGAAVLGFTLHAQTIHDQIGVDITEFVDSDPDLKIPSLVNALPIKLIPSVHRKKDSFTTFRGLIRGFRKTKGIMLNTFAEFESHAIDSLSNNNQYPPIYPVGPILNLDGGKSHKDDKSKDIIEWLDDQPRESVVFLCFGSMGSFGEEQAKEIAHALERSGYRFLWSLRKPPSKDEGNSTSEYHDLKEILPEGFLDRTAAVGRVTGWAPQVEVLAHEAVGGFVSHCGWNSILESIWHGVPIAAWPLYAEQQFNAFELVVELGLATKIKFDYGNDKDMIVSAEDIENGIRCLMEDERLKKRVKEMSERSRSVLMEGGSSRSALDRFIADVMP